VEILTKTVLPLYSMSRDFKNNRSHSNIFFRTCGFFVLGLVISEVYTHYEYDYYINKLSDNNNIKIKWNESGLLEKRIIKMDLIAEKYYSSIKRVEDKANNTI